MNTPAASSLSLQLAAQLTAMRTYRQLDAAYPPGQLPPGCEMVAGYIGREGFATNVWDPGQWLPFAGVRQVPYWVPDINASPAAEAVHAAAVARSLGWAPFMPAGQTRLIVFDFETAGSPADRAWWNAATAQLGDEGFTGAVYGSLSSVLELAASFVVVAAWDNESVLLPGQTMIGHQYQANVEFDGTTIDYSIMSQWAYDRAGRGPRHIPG